ncbi:MAG: hypothetical protein IIA88_01910, partial [Bacteroidetes bacterium]|nr:hypothetical protein [Bacteroidota bacterium]
MNSISYSQELETVGAGVIDFLLTNPKTASKTNATEAAALGVIRNLLSISGHRKHQMNVANAVRSEIVINTTGGSQATMYSDNEGNIYILFNEKIYPISKGLVNQARGEVIGAKIKNSTLLGYNVLALKNEYKFEKTDEYQKYFLKEKKETLDEIVKKHN